MRFWGSKANTFRQGYSSRYNYYYYQVNKFSFWKAIHFFSPHRPHHTHTCIDESSGLTETVRTCRGTPPLWDGVGGSSGVLERIVRAVSPSTHRSSDPVMWSVMWHHNYMVTDHTHQFQSATRRVSRLHNEPIESLLPNAICRQFVKNSYFAYLTHTHTHYIHTHILPPHTSRPHTHHAHIHTPSRTSQYWRGRSDKRPPADTSSQRSRGWPLSNPPLSSTHTSVVEAVGYKGQRWGYVAKLRELLLSFQKIWKSLNLDHSEVSYGCYN